MPPTDPRHAAIVDHVDAPMMQVVDERGMRYSLRILDVTLEDLRQGFVVRSGGRLQLS